MKLKTSFCNTAVLKKDLSRFLPLWGIYLIGALLLASTFHDSSSTSVAADIKSIMVAMPIISCGYALMVALFLYGDLYNSRLCNALHAMPLRRETWFFSHLISGLLMSLGPNLIVTLMLIPMLDTFWYVALLWLGGSTLMYLFFFGLATFCALATGNRFAAIVVYALANTFSLIIYWLLSELIMPYLYGVTLNTQWLYRLCPLYPMIEADYWRFGYFQLGVTEPAFDTFPQKGYTLYLSDGWGYLFITAAIGIGLMLWALLLYRKRKLECAGDFAAGKAVRWVVAIFGSLACGMVFRLFGLDNSALKYMLLFLGTIIGFFLLQMLLQRRVKVFNKPTVVKCLCLVLILAVILICGVVDIFGFETYIPKESSIDYVLLANTSLDSLDIADLIESEYPYLNYSSLVKLTEDGDIRRIRALHQDILEQRPESGRAVTIAYILDDGSIVTRVYYLDRDSSLYETVEDLLLDQTGVFGTDNVFEVIKNLRSCFVEDEPIDKSLSTPLIKALWLDALEGKFSDTDVWAGEVMVSLEYDVGDEQLYREFMVQEGSNAYDYIFGKMKSELSSPEKVFGMSAEELSQRVIGYCWDGDACYEAQVADLIEALLADCSDGNLAQLYWYHWDDDAAGYLTLTLTNGDGSDGLTSCSVTIYTNSQTFELLQKQPSK